MNVAQTLKYSLLNNIINLLLFIPKDSLEYQNEGYATNAHHEQYFRCNQFCSVHTLFKIINEPGFLPVP
jgi:hypothetical protein